MFTSFVFFIMATVLGERGIGLFVYDRYMAFTLAKIGQLTRTSQYFHSVIINTSQNLFCKAKGPAYFVVCLLTQEKRENIGQYLSRSCLWDPCCGQICPHNGPISNREMRFLPDPSCVGSGDQRLAFTPAACLRPILFVISRRKLFTGLMERNSNT